MMGIIKFLFVIFHIVLILACSITIINAQVNIIKNPGLEDWQNGHPVDWKVISFSPDFFRANMIISPAEASSLDEFTQKRVPLNGHNGLSYFGLGINEIVEGYFSRPLTKGKKYTFSCWVAKPKYNIEPSLSLFTVSFSNVSLPAQISNLKIDDAHVMMQPNTMAVDENEWKYIRTSFVARGIEDRFQLGYFNKLSQDLYKIYYVFDDFQLFDEGDNRMMDTKSIFFKTNQYVLEKWASNEINQFIKQFIVIDSIVVSGYANEVGDEIFNLELSRKRCLELKNIIVKLKPKTKIRTVANGEKVSVNNDLEEYRKVDVEVYHKGKYDLKSPKFDSSLMVKLQKLLNKDECYHAISGYIASSFGKSKNYIFSFMANSKKKFDVQLNLQIDNIINKYGYPGLSKVSPAYMDIILLLLLRSDATMRIKYFDLIKDEMERGEINKIGYAYLVDKMKMDEGKQQEYGTLIQWHDRSKSYDIYPVEELKGLDDKRYDIGLPPVRIYLEVINNNKRFLKE